MLLSRIRTLSRCSWASPSVKKLKGQGHYRFASSLSVKEVEIPVPFVKGHIAAKIWENGPGSSSAPKLAPIICINGWGDSVTAFEPLAPLLLKDRPGQTLLAFDLPGHGLSYHTPGAYSDLHMEGLLSVLRIIRHFSWEKVTILGHSFGGLLGLSFTSAFPDLVKSLIGVEMFHPLFINVEGYNGLAFTNSCIENLYQMENKMMSSAKANRPPPSYTREEMIQKMVKGREPQGGLTPEGCDMLIDRGSKKLPDGRLQFTHDPRNAQFFFLARLTLDRFLTMADGVTCPMQVISCHHSWNPEEVPRIKELKSKLAQNAKPFNEIKVTGTHHVHMLQPEVVAPTINQFLSSL